MSNTECSPAVLQCLILWTPQGGDCKGRNTPAQPLDAWGVCWDSDEVGNKSVRWSFRSHSGVVCSDSACEVWGGGLSDVWVIGFSDWLCASESARRVGGEEYCALCFSMHSVPSFPVVMLCSPGTRLVVMSVQDELICVRLCLAVCLVCSCFCLK